MELIPINESKIKIMLNESDMKAYNIGDEADCANRETRIAIRNILDRAKEQIGFNTEGSEIFVQLFTSKQGGCELFVTKSELQAPKEEQRSPDRRVKKKGKSGEGEEHGALTVRQEGAMSTKRSEFGRMGFSFDSLLDMCEVCRILCDRSDMIRSHAYRDDADRYYLVLENTSTAAYTRLDKFTFILEFGLRERTEHLSTYLCEHAYPICLENAISTLSNF